MNAKLVCEDVTQFLKPKSDGASWHENKHIVKLLKKYDAKE